MIRRGDRIPAAVILPTTFAMSVSRSTLCMYLVNTHIISIKSLLRAAAEEGPHSCAVGSKGLCGYLPVSAMNICSPWGHTN